MLLSLQKTKSLARFGYEFAKWLLLEACVNLVITGNTFALERVSANRSVQVRTADFNFFFVVVPGCCSCKMKSTLLFLPTI